MNIFFLRGDDNMIYQLINEMVKISIEYPVTYDIFCVLVIFIIASAYNSFKRLNINLIGIFLSSTLSYSVLYLVWKIRILNLEFNNDMKLITCILTGFVSIEFFNRFNPVVVVSFIIEFLLNNLLAYLDKRDKERKKAEKEGANNESENQEVPKKDSYVIKKEDEEVKTFSGFKRTK